MNVPCDIPSTKVHLVETHTSGNTCQILLSIQSKWQKEQALRIYCQNKIIVLIKWTNVVGPEAVLHLLVTFRNLKSLKIEISTHAIITIISPPGIVIIQ